MILINFHRWKIAFAISLGIHAAVILTIAMQTSRTVPIIEGLDIIMISPGVTVGDKGGFGDVREQEYGTGKGKLTSADETYQQEIKNKLVQTSDIEVKNMDSVAESGVTEPDSAFSEIAIAQTNSPVPSPEKKIKPGKPDEKNPSVKRKYYLKSVKLSVVKKTELSEKIEANTFQKGKKNEYYKNETRITGTKVKDGESNKVNAKISGITADTVKTKGSATGREAEKIISNDQFVENDDGTYTALSSSGISYRILLDAAPQYPQDARALGYTKIMKVRVLFLVGFDGRIESVEILTDKIPNLGFKEETIIAIKAMRFEPIWYKGRNIKMYFKKTIVFEI